MRGSTLIAECIHSTALFYILFLKRIVVSTFASVYPPFSRGWDSLQDFCEATCLCFFIVPLSLAFVNPFYPPCHSGKSLATDRILLTFCLRQKTSLLLKAKNSLNSVKLHLHSKLHPTPCHSGTSVSEVREQGSALRCYEP